DNDLIEELYNNIEMLNFQNVMNLEEYINYSEENNITRILSDQELLDQVTCPEPESETAKCDKEDDSIEIPQVIHKEALDAIHLIELYLIQQDLSDEAQ
ncbi:18308_t:CDS:1, partial [Racocetra fulgida]